MPPDTAGPGQQDRIHNSAAAHATDEYDYAGAFRLIDEGKPGADGCFGCFRCRAGDHGSCHGCSCPCAWRGSAASLRGSFGALIPPNACPQGCGS